MIQVGARTTPGMGQLLNQMARPHAANLAENSEKLNLLNTFLGPERILAAKRMKQTRRLVEKLTNIPDAVNQMARLQRWDKRQTYEFYEGLIAKISGEDVDLQTAQLGEYGSFNPMAYDFSGADINAGDYNLPTLKDAYLQKYENMLTAQYITNQMTNPSAEFAQELVMSAIVPIARQMIPNTVFLKAFITDTAIGELSKPYFLKNRYKAFQLGLNVLATQNPPTEIQTYDPMLVTPEEWERVVTIDMKYIETANFDVGADVLSDGGRELQVLIDLQAFAGLDVALPNITPPPGGSTAGAYSSDTTNTVMALAPNQPPLIDHLNIANMLLRQRGYNPDLMIISPFELGVLMSQQAILMSYAYGTREVQETGLVGTLVGNAVAWCPNLSFGGAPSSYGMWICDSDELARTVLGMPITVFPFFMRRQIQYDLYTRLEIFYRNVLAAVKVQCSNNTANIS